MPLLLTAYRVFIASPGGLEAERQAVREAIHAYNESEALPRRALFLPVGWERTLGGVGRPQELINRQLRDCDYFLLLLWDRWGSPPDPANAALTSGAEEEFRVAVECYHDPGRPLRQVVVCFKHVDEERMSAPGEQLRSVLAFRKTLQESRSLLYTSFDVTDALADLVRRHLGQWLRDHEDGLPEKGKPAVADARQRLSAPLGLPAERAPRGGGSFLLAEAEKLLDAGRLTEAEAVLARAVVREGSPDAFLRYGEFLYRDGRVAQAEVMFDRALELARQGGDRRTEAGALQALGHLHRERGDLPKAEELFAGSVEVARAAPHPDVLAAGLRHVAGMRASRGDLAEAERLLEQALGLDERAGNPRGAAATLHAQGRIAWLRGDYAAAEALHRRALDVDDGTGDRAEAARGRIDLGRALQAQARYDEAARMYRAALQASRAAGFLEGCVRAHNNLGNLFVDLGEYDRAERMYRRALAENEALGQVAGIAGGFNNLGIVRHARGDLQAAGKMYRRAIAMHEARGSVADAAGGYLNLGMLFQEARDLDRAEEAFRRALRLAQELGNEHFAARAYFGLGAAALLRGGREEAERLFDVAGSYDSPVANKLLRELRAPPASAGAEEVPGPRALARAMAQLRERYWGAEAEAKHTSG